MFTSKILTKFMVQFKALQVLRTFTPDEVKEFEKFLASPFFSTGRDLTGLFNYLKKYYPLFDNEKVLSLEKIHSKISKGKSKPEATGKLLSDLYKQTEDFLIIKNFSSISRQRKVLLLKEFRKKHIYGLYDSVLNTLEKDYSIEGKAELDFFYDLGTFEAEKCFIHNQRGDMKKYFRSFINWTDSVLTVSLLTLFESIPNKNVLENFYGLKPEFTLFDELNKLIDFEKLLDTLKQNNYKHYEILALHYFICKAHLTPGNDEYYYKSRDLFFSGYKLYSKLQVQAIFQNLQALCLNNIDTLKKEFYDELIKLYRFVFGKNILFTSKDDYITLSLFKNIIVRANKESIHWTDEFVNDNINRLEPSSRKAMKSFWLAQKALLQKKFKESMSLIHKIDINTPVLKTDIKHLYLANYYESRYFEEARSVLETFSKYLRNNPEVSRKAAEGNLNFLAIYKKLLQAVESGTNNNNEDIIKEIHKDKLIVKRDWLLEKANELM